MEQIDILLQYSTLSHGSEGSGRRMKIEKRVIAVQHLFWVDSRDL